MKKKETLFPKAYFKQIQPAIQIFSDKTNNKLTTREFAKKIGLSPTYTFNYTNLLLKLDFIKNIGIGTSRYTITEKGEQFHKMFKENDPEKLRTFGESVISTEKCIAIQKALEKLRIDKNISPTALGEYLVSCFDENVKSSQYFRIGSCAKSILNGFYLLDEKQIPIQTQSLLQSTDEILGNLHRYCNQLIAVVTCNSNGWENYIDLKDTIEQNFNELSKVHYDIPVRLLIEQSKKWLKEGYIHHEINFLRNSIDLLTILDMKKLIQ